MTLTTLHSEKADLSITAEGHIHIRIHEEVEIDLYEVMEINAAKDELVAGEKYTVIFQAPQIGNISIDAQRFAASHECYHNAIAKAIVTPSLPSRIIGNFFIKFHRPPAPTKVFNSVAEAAEWLNKKRLEVL
jgi:hypothetical protein